MQINSFTRTWNKKKAPFDFSTRIAQQNIQKFCTQVGRKKEEGMKEN